jgi:fumarate reductase subunit D
MKHQPPRPYRRNALWFAAMLHRFSGIGLALFLPLHFLVLGLSLHGADKLDRFLRWTDLPAVRFAEAGLVFLLAVHLLGGLRILLAENLNAFGNQLRLATTAGGLACLVGFAFLICVF